MYEHTKKCIFIPTCAFLCTLTVMVGLYEITKVQEMVRHCSYNIMVSPEERLGEMMIYCGSGDEYKIYKDVTSEV